MHYETFPGNRFLLNAGHGYCYQVIEPYLKNPQVFRCPSYSGSNAVSYGYNGYGTTASNGLGWRYASSGGPVPSQWPPTLAQIEMPAQMIMLGDHSDSTGDMRGYGNVGDWQLPTARHNEVANLCFVDGHAKWLKNSDYTPNAPAGWTLSGYLGCDRQWNMWVRNPSSSTGYRRASVRSRDRVGNSRPELATRWQRP